MFKLPSQHVPVVSAMQWVSRVFVAPSRVLVMRASGISAALFLVESPESIIWRDLEVTPHEVVRDFSSSIAHLFSQHPKFYQPPTKIQQYMVAFNLSEIPWNFISPWFRIAAQFPGIITKNAILSLNGMSCPMKYRDTAKNCENFVPLSPGNKETSVIIVEERWGYSSVARGIALLPVGRWQGCWRHSYPIVVSESGLSEFELPACLNHCYQLLPYHHCYFLFVIIIIIVMTIAIATIITIIIIIFVYHGETNLASKQINECQRSWFSQPQTSVRTMSETITALLRSMLASGLLRISYLWGSVLPQLGSHGVSCFQRNFR